VAAAGTAARAQDAAPGITVNGTVEVNYTANFNEPFNGSNTYLFNQKEGQFALNLASLTFAKAATPQSRAGFNIRLVAGEVSRLNFNAGDDNRILEAYGRLLIPLGGKELTFDAGQFVTHVGYETIDIGTNVFFSRNFLFQFPSPFYNAGVRAAYPLSEKLTLTGYIYNRYNGVNDSGNRDPAPGFQLLYNISPTSQLIFNGLGSRENLNYTGAQPGAGFVPDGTPGADNSNVPNNKQQTILDLIYTTQFSPSFKFAFEGLDRFGKDAANNSYNVWGVAGYFMFPFKNGNSANLRAEYLKQDKATSVIGLPATKDFHVGSITASYNLSTGLFPGARTIIEYRYDFAKDPFFAGKGAGELKDTQNSLTIGQVYSF
jgi:hypothetical protein